jgi:hypothetical protein
MTFMVLIARRMKIVAFAALLAVIFIAAHAAGAHFGPVNSGRSHVQYVGGDTTSDGPGPGGMDGGDMQNPRNMGGMDMSGRP